ncbi:MAG: APC family permease [Actinobacteria bacterium]|nr:APC family permease [Actinomycetota bacterium]
MRQDAASVNTDAKVVTPAIDEEAARLAELGIDKTLHRTLSVPAVVGLGVAVTSPTLSVVVFSSIVFVVGGTFGIGAQLLMIPVVAAICLCLAELGAMYPLAGAMYSLVRQVLPQPLSVVAIFHYLVIGVVANASIGLSVGPFLRDLIPGLHASDQLIAVVLLVTLSCVALTRVEIGAAITVGIVVFELIALGVITVAALLHPHQNVGDLVFHPTILHGHQLVGVTTAIMVATLAPAFTVINGFDATLGFSEELAGGPRALAKSVLVCGAAVTVIIIVPLICSVVAAPSLTAFLGAPVPVMYSVTSSLGEAGTKILDLGAVAALTCAMLSVLMYDSRILFGAARDGVWPRPASVRLASRNRFRVPGFAVVVIASVVCVLAVAADITFLVNFLGAAIAALFVLVGVAALVSRVTQREVARPFRYPLWPIPPLIVIAITVLALVKQEASYLHAELVLLGASLLYWLLSRLWVSNWTWRVTPNPGAPTDVVEAQPALAAGIAD